MNRENNWRESFFLKMENERVNERPNKSVEKKRNSSRRKSQILVNQCDTIFRFGLLYVW